MTIMYCGQIKGESHNTRCAMICWNEDNEREEILANRIEDLAYKTTDWKNFSFFDGCCTIPMDDRSDYNDFVEFYKEAKRMFIGCMKYGF